MQNPYRHKDGSPIICEDDRDTFWYSERADEWEGNAKNDAADLPEPRWYDEASYLRYQIGEDNDIPFCFACHSDVCTCVDEREYGPFVWEVAPSPNDLLIPDDCPF